MKNTDTARTTEAQGPVKTSRQTAHDQQSGGPPPSYGHRTAKDANESRHPPSKKRDRKESGGRSQSGDHSIKDENKNKLDDDEPTEMETSVEADSTADSEALPHIDQRQVLRLLAGDINHSIPLDRADTLLAALKCQTNVRNVMVRTAATVASLVETRVTMEEVMQAGGDQPPRALRIELAKKLDIQIKALLASNRGASALLKQVDMHMLAWLEDCNVADGAGL